MAGYITTIYDIHRELIRDIVFHIGCPRALGRALVTARLFRDSLNDADLALLKQRAVVVKTVTHVEHNCTRVITCSILPKTRPHGTCTIIDNYSNADACDRMTLVCEYVDGIAHGSATQTYEYCGYVIGRFIITIVNGAVHGWAVYDAPPFVRRYLNYCNGEPDGLYIDISYNGCLKHIIEYGGASNIAIAFENNVPALVAAHACVPSDELEYPSVSVTEIVSGRILDQRDDKAMMLNATIHTIVLPGQVLLIMKYVAEIRCRLAAGAFD